MVLAALEGQPELAAWPASYAIRRLAWHVADHAWEIEERHAAVPLEGPVVELFEQ